jgi:hypothetical protein
MARMFCDEDEFYNAHAHIKRAKEHAVDDKYLLGRAMDEHAEIWYRQGRPEEAVCEVMGAMEIYGKLGAAKDLEDCEDLLQRIEQSIKKP